MKANNFCVVAGRAGKPAYLVIHSLSTTFATMPKLESNLLYGSAQQTKPWRAGTPGRAPRYRRAVVDIRRPLCLFIAFTALLAGLAGPSFAQQSSRKLAFQVRVGVMGFSSLVEDELGSSGVTDSIPGQSDRVSVRQQPAPTLVAAALVPLRERTALEISAGFAASSLRGEDDESDWDMGGVSVATALLGISHGFTEKIQGHGAIGLTRLFGDQSLLNEGNSVRPVLEAGVSLMTPLHPALRLDARVQAHRFNSTALQNEGATDGTVLRWVIAGSFTVGGSTP
jgi:hypothetical protein